MTSHALGWRAIAALSFSLEKLEDHVRILLMNADESGSMGSSTHQNVKAYETVSKLIGGVADVVIVHGFASDGFYDVVFTAAAKARLGPPEALLKRCQGTSATVASQAEAVEKGRALLASHSARGSTNPGSHPVFLEDLGAVLEAAECEVELVVVNSSDGGFDGGPRSPLTQKIDEAMRRVASRCHCFLAANVLVGSSGSPEALTFFTGDPERFDNRLLFSTVAASAGVLHLDAFDPTSLVFSEAGASKYTVSPGLPVWMVETEGDAARLLVWHPAGAADLPSRVTVRRSDPHRGTRRAVLRCDVGLDHHEATLDRDGREVLRMVARSLSDNPYLRERSREALNGLIAPLEGLLATRRAVLATLTAGDDLRSLIEEARAQVVENTAAIKATIEQPGLTPRERSSRVNALNNARHLLKASLRKATEAAEQQAIEREFAFYEQHPDHWLVWLQPAIDDLKEQLGLTHADPGDAMAHLSTRIRTAKSAQDGKARSADRYIDRLLAESRDRRDHLARKADPADAVPFETPGAWIEQRCPVSGRPLTEGLAAIPFAADRGDLTSGNVMAGGQNVDRLCVDRGPMLSLSAVRELMWGELGQMASPYLSQGSFYNAAIPVLLGPASRESLRDLERAIGWLCTGTTAFGAQMTEAIPGALAVLLGAPGRDADGSPEVQALLRTSALLPGFRSYPYVAGTSVFNESVAKLPITEVWATSVEDAAGSACLQNMGCITSLFARAVAADRVDPSKVALDLFSWGCRNLARSMLGDTGHRDGRSGVEGVRRLASLVHHLVELEGYPLDLAAQATAADAKEPSIDPRGSLDHTTLSWVLGPLSDRLRLAPPLPVAGFTDALNQALSALPSGEAMGLLSSLDEVFGRLDALVQAQADEAGEAETLRRAAASVAPRVSPPRTHQGFDIASLDEVRPRRLSTPVPGVSSPRAALRRRLHAGKTDWIPPADASLSPSSSTPYNPSALAFLEAHTAFYPLRAWLRLSQAGLVGQPALASLRASSEVRPIPPLPSFFPGLAAIAGGMGEVVRMFRRALAFVVANANGYADNQWTGSPLRTAGDAGIDKVLDPIPAGVASPVAYVSTVAFAGEDEEPWPRMDSNGYLPKSRAIDAQGRSRLAPMTVAADALAKTDAEVCSLACTRMLEGLAADGVVIFGGLHRFARELLGQFPHDLNAMSEPEREQALAHELIPALAGRIKGDPRHPKFFSECRGVLRRLLALGGDTRRFRAVEPADMLASEASEIRARSAAG